MSLTLKWMSLRRAATAFALLALMLATSVGTSTAQSRGQWRGGGGDAGRRGGPAYSGGARGFTGGGQAYSGGGSRGGYVRGGHGGAYGGGYGGGYRGGYPGAYRGGYGYRGGYHYHRPHAYLGFSFGAPSYYEPYYYDPYYHEQYVHPYVVDTDPEVIDSRSTVVEPPPARRVTGEDPGEIDVTNEPPAGCYYYDRVCDRRFATLDDYTNHLDKQDHDKTVEIIRTSDGQLVRKLEFSGEYWGLAGTDDSQ